MAWLAVRVGGASETARDAISAALIDAGAACVQEDRGDLITYLPDDAPLDGVRGAVRADEGAVLDLREAPTRRDRAGVALHRRSLARRPPHRGAAVARAGCGRRRRHRH